MRRRREPAEAPRPAEQDGFANDGGGWTDKDAWREWWGGVVQRWGGQADNDFGQPLMLRVPRGVAVAALGGIVVLLIIAYGVGYARGRSATADAGPGYVAGIDPGSMEMRGMRKPPAAIRVDPAGELIDPRVPGSNYLIVAQYPEDEAERLSDFLWERGVETLLQRLDNGRFHVIVVTPPEGFTKEAMGLGEHVPFRTQMLALGRAWKQHNGNRGDDLTSMYFKRFDPPPGKTNAS